MRGTQPLRASIVDPYIAFLRQTLEQYPGLRATRFYQMIRDGRYSGSVVQLRRSVACSVNTRCAKARPLSATVTSHQSEGTVERRSQKPLSKMLGRRCSAFSAARAPGLVHDRDPQRALPLPGLQTPFLPVCWQIVPAQIQTAHGDGTGRSGIV